MTLEPTLRHLSGPGNARQRNLLFSQSIDQRLRLLRLRLPLRILNELTPTVPTLIVLLPPVASAVLGDIVRPTSRTGHLNRHRANSLFIAMVYLIFLCPVH
jgi:hypothetical protein